MPAWPSSRSVTGVAEPRHDKGAVVEPLVDGRGIDRHIGVFPRKMRDAFGTCDEVHETHPLCPLRLELPRRGGGAVAGAEGVHQYQRHTVTEALIGDIAVTPQKPVARAPGRIGQVGRVTRHQRIGQCGHADCGAAHQQPLDQSLAALSAQLFVAAPGHGLTSIATRSWDRS